MADERSSAQFPEYLDGFVNFSKGFFDRALDATKGDPDLQPTVRVLAETAVTAARELAGELGGMYEQANESARSVVDQQLRLSGGMALIRAANEAVSAPGANSKLGLAWIGIIIHLLKKLIKILWKKNRPPWLDDLLEFIDELWEIIQSMLGGKVASRLAHEMTTRWLTLQRLLIERDNAEAATATQ